MTPKNPKDQDSNWPHDRFAQSEVASQVWLIWTGAIVLVLGVIISVIGSRFGKQQPQVVAYCAQDQLYAEPILRDFERVAGIRVLTLYDGEAVKTVGLANRLLAERKRPRADVFWGNEEFRTRQLAAQEVFRPEKGWAAFGYRSRRIVVNTNLVQLADAPRSLLELTNAAWKGKVALAYPQFGTTSTHFHALRQAWGEAAWLAWCRSVAANKPFLVDGNSVVVQLVGRGEASIGLTDSDDIAAGQREGLPVAAVPTGPETLLIPNTAGLVRGAPHAAAAQQLFEYLLREGKVAQRLVAAQALEGDSVNGVAAGTLQVNWENLLRDLDKTTSQLNEVFLR